MITILVIPIMNEAVEKYRRVVFGDMPENWVITQK